MACLAATLLAGAAVLSLPAVWAQPTSIQATTSANLALVATPSASYVSGDQTVNALNDGFDPANSNDQLHGAYGNRNRTGTQWVQYEWSQPVSVNRMDVYWFADGRGITLPKASRVKYWDGNEFVLVNNAQGLGVEANTYNSTTFPEITTTRLRLEFDSQANTPDNSTGILEWKVYDSGKSPAFAPRVNAGIERLVVLTGKTFLNGSVRALSGPETPVTWSKASGPGTVTFANPSAKVTTATFSSPGEYQLKLTAGTEKLSGSDVVRVRVEPAAPAAHLEAVYTTTYKIDSPFWNKRVKNLIVNWIPHCNERISDLNLKEGGIANFIQAANKLAGKPAAPHVGYPFSNAWVYNMIESMSVALMVDPQGDREIIAAQNAMRAKMEEWIPIILAAQEPDGYLQTRFTLGTARERGNTPPHWDPRYRGEHEGYVAGYFLEAAIAHHLASGGKDVRLYNAAKRLADCWYNNIGPAPKKPWYDGHQEMEQALVRFGRYVNDIEGAGKGQKYVELAKFLLDSRHTNSPTDGSYDQSHLPAIQQYEALGHAVRAVYFYSGMADVAVETGDIDYQSAIKSLWNNLVNKKYYVTGGIGSGETSEGFGPNYSLRNNSYCESCSGSGELFFQWKMHLAYHDAKYADLYEETLYNAILGDVDLEAQNFTYTNPLDARSLRYKWHNCPCCVGNIPRTLLMLPTWMYSKGADELYVNLFIGSTVDVGNVAGTPVQMVQTTNYPWNGNVAIIVNPAQPRRFSLKIRVPDRSVSELYTSAPEVNGLTSIAVNGAAVTPAIDRGYAVITREWKAGDKVELVLPLKVQRVKADEHVAADRGRVALRYGPLVYNIESVDQELDKVLKADAPLAAEWRGDLLDGVMVIKGAFADGSPMMAIPNYARMNRGPGRSIVWMRDE